MIMSSVLDVWRWLHFLNGQIDKDVWKSFIWMCDECEAFTDAAPCLTLDCFLMHSLFVYCCHCENVIEPARLFSKVGRLCVVFTSLKLCFCHQRDVFCVWQKCLCAFGERMMSQWQLSRSFKSSFGKLTGRQGCSQKGFLCLGFF